MHKTEPVHNTGQNSSSFIIIANRCDDLLISFSSIGIFMETSYLMTVQVHQTAVQTLITTVESQARELSEHRRFKQLDDDMIT